MRYFRFEYMIYIYTYVPTVYGGTYVYIYICLFVYIYIYVCIYTSTYLYVYTHMYYTTTWHLLIYAYILHIHPLSSRFNQPLDAIFFRKNLTHTWQVSTCRCDIDRAHHSCVGNCQWFCPNDWKVKDDQFLSFFLFFLGHLDLSRIWNCPG